MITENLKVLALPRMVSLDRWDSSADMQLKMRLEDSYVFSMAVLSSLYYLDLIA